MRHLLAILVVSACAGEPAADVADRRSDQCDGIAGMEALAWDLYAGLPVTDPVLPPPAPVGPVYGHPDLPLLGFTHPPGWTPLTLRGTSALGVDLLRDDDDALWRYASAPATGPVTAAQVVDSEVLAARDRFGLDGQGTVVCRFTNAGEVTPGTGILGDVVHVLVRIDDHTLLVAASVLTVSPSLPPSVFVRTLTAPTAEWPDLLYDTFLAIDWQLLFGGGRSEDDRDGDGVWDVFDAFPDDPTRS